ncbi:MAG: phosphotransferase, partial [Calditrichia bacterium]|nr:phosphotransferase [Calditrichia bacterium]
SNCEKIEEEFVKLSENTVLPLLKGLWGIKADFYGELEQFALSKYFFEWEFHTNFQLIQNHFGKIGKSIEPKFWELIISVLFEKFSQLLQTKFVPIHRDLQSSNMFLKNEKLYVIDFQDMYLGHPLYDAVSWIFDSYVELPLDFRFNCLNKIIKKYSAEIDPLRETGQLMQEGLLLVFQRKLHDAGAFVFADDQLKSKHFEPYIIPAVKMAAEAANRLKNETLIHLTQSLLKFDSKLITGETV